jgi:predicted O-methyltransferase YrrM
MYSRLQLARKYLRYYLTAANGKGHGIHSPFVFDFIIHVLNDTREFPEYTPIRQLRRQLEKDPAILEIEDMGAGSALNGTRRRSVSELARHAAKPEKLGQLLFRIARYYRSASILELGTSLGISTAYLAAGGIGARVITIEGADAVAAVADRNFQSLGLQQAGLGRPILDMPGLQNPGLEKQGLDMPGLENPGLGKIELVRGNFDHALAPALDRIGHVDLAFVDGNHRREPTLRYFEQIITRCSPQAVLIFDDIHWSAEMEEAWEQIKKDPRVYLTIDLFFIGLVFLRSEFKVKQNFTIRY